ncbi:MAG: hypothetical protein HC837_21600 [Chloroflexaceae bacterium]|nr:hypothetical protein [Chloroflexaceae bacterium]
MLLLHGCWGQAGPPDALLDLCQFTAPEHPLLLRLAATEAITEAIIKPQMASDETACVHIQTTLLAFIDEPALHHELVLLAFQGLGSIGNEAVASALCDLLMPPTGQPDLHTRLAAAWQDAAPPLIETPVNEWPLLDLPDDIRISLLHLLPKANQRRTTQ